MPENLCNHCEGVGECELVKTYSKENKRYEGLVDTLEKQGNLPTAIPEITEDNLNHAQDQHMEIIGSIFRLADLRACPNKFSFV